MWGGEEQEADRTIFPGWKGCKEIGSLKFPCECVELLADVFLRQLLGLADLRLLALLAHGDAVDRGGGCNSIQQRLVNC